MKQVPLDSIGKAWEEALKKLARDSEYGHTLIPLNQVSEAIRNMCENLLWSNECEVSIWSDTPIILRVVRNDTLWECVYALWQQWQIWEPLLS